MTGFSIPRNMEDVKRLAPYYKKLISMVLIVGGSALMIEHLFEYKGFDLLDFAGHEFYGIGISAVTTSKIADGAVTAVKLAASAVANTSEPALISCHNATGSEIAIRAVCYISGDQSGVPQIIKAQANAEANAKGMLVITTAAIGNGAAGYCRVLGKVTGFSGLTPGAIQYLSDDTAGAIEETATVTATEIVRVVGYAISATVVFFHPDISYIEVAA